MPRAPAISISELRHPQAKVLIVGLVVGYALFLSQVGLRWGVLMIGLGPPIGAVVLWQRQERQRRNQDVPTKDLLDPTVFHERLNQLIDIQSLSKREQAQWRASHQRLQTIHNLIVRCAELDTTASVDLLVLLEILMDHASHLASCLHQLADAATPGARALFKTRTNELNQQLHQTLRQLQSCHDVNLRENLRNHVLPSLPLITPFPPKP